MATKNTEFTKVLCVFCAFCGHLFPTPNLRQLGLNLLLENIYQLPVRLHQSPVGIIILVQHYLHDQFQLHFVESALV